MFDALDRVRDKPPGERRAIAFSIAAVITGVIFILWIVSFFASIDNEQKTIVKPSGTFNFNTFTDSFKEAKDTIQKEVGAAREQLEFINNELKESGVNDVNGGDGSEPNTEAPNEDVKTEVTPSGIEIIKVEN